MKIKLGGQCLVLTIIIPETDRALKTVLTD